jgi:hypothetical protein
MSVAGPRIVQDDQLDIEREIWNDNFEHGLEHVAFLAMEAAAQFCPVCKRDCGTADFTPDDPSVGIFGVCWGNECPVHGIFSTDSEGVQELEESS